MKMCEAFSDRFESVFLFAQKTNNTNFDKHLYYGVKPSFTIIESYWPKLTRFAGFVYALQNRSYVKKIDHPVILYGRNSYSLFLTRNMGFPIILEVHQSPVSDLFRYMERGIINSQNFSHLIVISKKLKEIYLNLFDKLNTRNVLVVPDAADDPFANKSRKAEISGRNGAIHIGYVGSLYPGRGVNKILEMAKLLPQADFHIIGGTDAEIVRYKNNQHPGNVYFYGHVPHGFLSGYYQQFDILIAPYQQNVSVYGNRGDTCQVMSPLKIFEYMASEKAIVASDLPALKEVLTHEKNALLCGPENITQWVETLNALISNSTLRTQMAQTARLDFIEKYTWRKRVDKVLNGLI
jgi:glycosyltransferase involved in cell wall biosynthesis